MKGQLKEAEDSGDQGGGVEEAEPDDSTTMTADDPEEERGGEDSGTFVKEKARLNSKKEQASIRNRRYYAKHKEEAKLYQKRRITREERPLDCFCDQKFADTPEGRKLRGACLKQHLKEAKMRHQFSDQQTIMSITS